MKKILAGLGFLAFLAAAGIALAQTYPPAQVPSVHPNQDLIQVIPYGTPQANAVYTTPAGLGATTGYVKFTPTLAAGYAGYSNYFGNTQTQYTYVLTATMLYAYITFAPSPSDGARECIYASGGTITNVYMYGNTGQTVTGAITTLSSNTGACYIYSLSNLTWDRD